jgi:acyl-coenzyme A thioesterase PaaI-like protein
LNEFAPFHDEPARGVSLPPDDWALSGLDRLNRDTHGTGTAPPIAHLTGLRPTTARPGTVEFVLPGSGWLLSSHGEISSTALTFFADAPIGSAVMTELGPATGIPTVELSLVFIRSTLPSDAPLRARGSTVSRDGDTAISSVEISDPNGALLAIGTTRVIIQPMRAVGERSSEAPASPPTPDPYRRPVIGEPLPAEIIETTSGLDILAGQIAGRLPLPPVAWLLGMRPALATPGETEVTAIASPWTSSPAGTVYGGWVAAVMEFALGCAARTVVPARGRERMLDLKVNYLRPLLPDGQIVSVRSSLSHRGRRVTVGEAEMRRGDGAVLARAVATTLIETP